jgi:YHS domain-containing protein
MKMLRLLAAALLLPAGCVVHDSGNFSWITHTWTTPYGVFALDHVSREKVDIENAVQRHYLGETYYFENEYNASVFDGNPWAYLYNDNVHLSARPDRVDQN